ncbi:hypothetical protein QBC38DRAFT_73840 [Podospora fimiseda]|uniref:Uncharacterized protein n=1 Tax=Podospora fimiseda TaxID=252190 RepID=A0AAN6YQ67_9PEZI|nr:hypothetical protein QBC38DRAFT_73840 [Podospora fimiseda]
MEVVGFAAAVISIGKTVKMTYKMGELFIKIAKEANYVEQEMKECAMNFRSFATAAGAASKSLKRAFSDKDDSESPVIDYMEQKQLPIELEQQAELIYERIQDFGDSIKRIPSRLGKVVTGLKWHRFKPRITEVTPHMESLKTTLTLVINIVTLEKLRHGAGSAGGVQIAEILRARIDELKQEIQQQMETIRQLREEHSVVALTTPPPPVAGPKSSSAFNPDQYLVLCHLAESIIETGKIPTAPPPYNYEIPKVSKRKSRHSRRQSARIPSRDHRARREIPISPTSSASAPWSTKDHLQYINAEPTPPPSPRAVRPNASGIIPSRRTSSTIGTQSTASTISNESRQSRRRSLAPIYTAFKKYNHVTIKEIMGHKKVRARVDRSIESNLVSSKTAPVGAEHVTPVKPFPFKRYGDKVVVVGKSHMYLYPEEDDNKLGGWEFLVCEGLEETEGERVVLGRGIMEQGEKLKIGWFLDLEEEVHSPVLMRSRSSASSSRSPGVGILPESSARVREEGSEQNSASERRTGFIQRKEKPVQKVVPADSVRQVSVGSKPDRVTLTLRCQRPPGVQVQALIDRSIKRNLISRELCRSLRYKCQHLEFRGERTVGRYFSFRGGEVKCVGKVLIRHRPEGEGEFWSFDVCVGLGDSEEPDRENIVIGRESAEQMDGVGWDEEDLHFL